MSFLFGCICLFLGWTQGVFAAWLWGTPFGWFFGLGAWLAAVLGVRSMLQEGPRSLERLWKLYLRSTEPHDPQMLPPDSVAVAFPCKRCGHAEDEHYRQINGCRNTYCGCSGYVPVFEGEEG